MILSKNGKSFISISHKKSLTKIVTAPHTKFERYFFRCRKLPNFGKNLQVNVGCYDNILARKKQENCLSFCLLNVTMKSCMHGKVRTYPKRRIEFLYFNRIFLTLK